MYEVELKFPLDDRSALLLRLEHLGAIEEAERHQQDRYFGHPARDFSQTDEAFRIRSDGEQNVITYKGPVVDPQVKSRQEIEIPIAEGPEAQKQLAQMLTLLGFREVRTVSKRRVSFRFRWESRAVELTLDSIDGLGEYVEIETIANEADRDAARDAILSLAAHFGLQHAERKSYLCLLLEQDA